MNILVIGAHFDDLEIGCGGTIARLINEKHSILGYVVSASGYNSLDNKVQRPDDLAEEEGKAAASLLGYELMYDQYETTKIKNNDDLIPKIERLIISNQIDLVLTHWIHDVTEDHQAVAHATAVAARKKVSVLMYRSNFYRLDQPFNASVLVDITDFIDQKKKAILCHKSEVKKFGNEWVDAIIASNRVFGYQSGRKYAEGFQPIRLVY